MPRGTESTLVYKRDMSRSEFLRTFKAVVIPIAVFGVGLFVISDMGRFGTKLLCPLSGVMWVIGLLVALLMPAQRREVLNQTLTMCAIYFGAIYGLKVLLGFVSGASPEMISASFEQAIPTAAGNAIPGYIQTMMYFVSVGIPIGHVSMQVKRFLQFRHNASLQKTFGQERGVIMSRNDNTRKY